MFKKVLVVCLATSGLVMAQGSSEHHPSNIIKTLKALKSCQSEIDNRFKALDERLSKIEERTKADDQFKFDVNDFKAKIHERVEVLEAGRSGVRNEFVNSTRLRLEALEGYVKALETALDEPTQVVVEQSPVVINEPTAPTLEEITK